MIGNFLPRRKPWLRDGRMLSMLYGGKEVRSQTSYILGTYRPLLQNVVVRGVYHNTDHYLVLSCLRKSAPDAHSCYLREQTRFPIKPTMTLGGVDRLFLELWGGGGVPIHIGGNALARIGFYWKTGNLSTPVFWHAGAGTMHSGAFKNSDIISRQVFRRTGAKGRPSRGPR